jgi:hypothetical protein
LAGAFKKHCGQREVLIAGLLNIQERANALYILDNRLVIGLATRALFDLEKSDAVRRDQGPMCYREFQRRKQDVFLNQQSQGLQCVAFKFPKKDRHDFGLRVLGLNLF